MGNILCNFGQLLLYFDFTCGPLWTVQKLPYIMHAIACLFSRLDSFETRSLLGKKGFVPLGMATYKACTGKDRQQYPRFLFGALL